MRVRRFYQPGEWLLGETINLSPRASKHISQVLRMRVGERLHVFDGNGHEHLAEIVDLKKSIVVVSITEVIDVLSESPIAIDLGQCISPVSYTHLTLPTTPYV